MAKQVVLCLYILYILTLMGLTNMAALSTKRKDNEHIYLPIKSNKSNGTEIGLDIVNDMKKKRSINIDGCIFDEDVINHENTIPSNVHCSYKQRSKTTAVLISIYFGVFGIDWFYLSRGNGIYIVVGLLKLLISFGCCTSWPLLTLSTRKVSNFLLMIGYIGGIVFSLISLFWWIVDWARILANKFPDGNGVELKHFSEYF